MIIITWRLLLASLLAWLNLSLLPSFDVVTGFFFFTIFTLGTTLRGGGTLALRSYNVSGSMVNNKVRFSETARTNTILRGSFRDVQWNDSSMFASGWKNTNLWYHSFKTLISNTHHHYHVIGDSGIPTLGIETPGGPDDFSELCALCTDVWRVLCSLNTMGFESGLSLRAMRKNVRLFTHFQQRLSWQ